jgi:hypothetical protein
MSPVVTFFVALLLSTLSDSGNTELRRFYD